MFLNRFFRWLTSLGKASYCQGGTEQLTCPNRVARLPVTVTVLGQQLSIAKVPKPRCGQCLEQYLNQHALSCPVCVQPILPGSPIAGCYQPSPDQPYTHLRCSSGEFYLGFLEPGRRIWSVVDGQSYPLGRS